MDFDWAREKMLEKQLKSKGINDPRILAAMAKIPRHLFLLSEYRNYAYCDEVLPIGANQTITQPYMQAFMIQCLELGGSERVLEVGTGSGYQTAVLLEIAKEVFSIERIYNLAQRACGILTELGYSNGEILVGDGTKGWQEKAPFEAIVVTAAATNDH